MSEHLSTLFTYFIEVALNLSMHLDAHRNLSQSVAFALHLSHNPRLQLPYLSSRHSTSELLEMPRTTGVYDEVESNHAGS